jgi:hypothetical protein
MGQAPLLEPDPNADGGRTPEVSHPASRQAKEGILPLKASVFTVSSDGKRPRGGTLYFWQTIQRVKRT